MEQLFSFLDNADPKHETIKLIQNSGERSYGTYLYIFNHDEGSFKFETGFIVSQSSVLACEELTDGFREVLTNWIR